MRPGMGDSWKEQVGNCILLDQVLILVPEVREEAPPVPLVHGHAFDYLLGLASLVDLYPYPSRLCLLHHSYPDLQIHGGHDYAEAYHFD